MFAIFRRAILATVLLGVVGVTLSGCIVYDDGRYHRGGWGERGWHDRDHERR